MGQIVRYLPGKVWGLIYEANALRGAADLRTITISILIQTIYGYAWATVLAAVLLAGNATQNPCYYLLLAPAACLLWLAHKNPVIWRLVSRLPLIGDRTRNGAFDGLRPSASWLLSGLIAINWIPFLCAWIFLLQGMEPIERALAWGSAYILASIISTALVVVPSGLVVREALFTWLGAVLGLPVADSLLYGLVVRLALTLADLANALFFAILQQGRQRVVAHEDGHDR